MITAGHVDQYFFSPMGLQFSILTLDLDVRELLILTAGLGDVYDVRMVSGEVHDWWGPRTATTAGS